MPVCAGSGAIRCRGEIARNAVLSPLMVINPFTEAMSRTFVRSSTPMEFMICLDVGGEVIRNNEENILDK